MSRAIKSYKLFIFITFPHWTNFSFSSLTQFGIFSIHPVIQRNRVYQPHTQHDTIIFSHLIQHKIAINIILPPSYEFENQYNEVLVVVVDFVGEISTVPGICTYDLPTWKLVHLTLVFEPLFPLIGCHRTLGVIQQSPWTLASRPRICTSWKSWCERLCLQSHTTRAVNQITF